MQYQFVRVSDSKIGIETPYNRAFVDELKAKVPSARWNGKIWTFSESSKPEAIELAEKYFPDEAALQTVQITWDLNRDNPTIDGIGLASIGRDYWNWRSDCSVDFRVIEADVDSGGSRKYPGLFGRLVIEAKIRPDATISPEPVSVEIVDSREPARKVTVELSDEAVKIFDRLMADEINILTEAELITAALNLYEMHRKQAVKKLQ